MRKIVKIEYDDEDMIYEDMRITADEMMNDTMSDYQKFCTGVFACYCRTHCASGKRY